mmetsp:Transcript_1358/g.3937  ORF Transcript_1358/g.3937 Transcript_1358/m.3937 type:complete len:420 (-) Transcript_1358:102-1361(-)
MGASDEQKPLARAAEGPGLGALALLVASAGGVYWLCPIPVSLAIITQEKVDLTPNGFDKETVSKSQTLFWIGWAAASVLVMPMADNFGRKPLYFGLLAVGLLATFLCTRAYSASLYGATMFAIGGTFPPAGVVGYLLLQESIPIGLWSTSTVALNVLYSSLSILVAVTSGTVTRDLSWRKEALLWHIPFLIILIVGPLLVSESPQFRQGAAAVNDSDAAEEKKEPWRQLWCNSQLRGRLLATIVCWAACTVGFYGLSYASGSLSDSLYINLALLAVVDLVSYGLAGVVIQMFGAKTTQIISFVSAMAVLVLCACLSSGPWRVVCAMCGRFNLNVGFTTIYLLLMDCFPAGCRGTAMGTANAVARLSGLVTPLFAIMQLGSVCLLMSSLCLFAALATWTLPEPERAEPRWTPPCCGEREL